MADPDRSERPPWYLRIGTRLGMAGLLLLTLSVREMFSFWTGHPYDFEVWIRTAFEVGQNPSVNPYESAAYGWRAVPGLSFAYMQGQFLPSAAYPPFWPSVLGELYRLWLAFGGGNRFVFYFLIKQPPILADVIVGLLLYRATQRWTGDRSSALGILASWALFPYDIIVSAIWGQFDAIIVVLLLAALLVSDPMTRNLLWGVGIFVKWLTVVFLPLELFLNRGWRRLPPLVAVALSVGLTVIAFAGAGWGPEAAFRLGGFASTTVSESQGGAGGMNYARILTIGPVAQALFGATPWIVELLPWLWVPGVIMAGWLAARQQAVASPSSQLSGLMLVLVVFFLLRFGLNEQYLLYLFPLMLLDATCFHPARRRFFVFLVVLCLGFLILNNALGIWFASPAEPSLWTEALAFNGGSAPFPSATGWIRAWVLNFLALLITITLVQLAYLLVRQRGEWTPWLLSSPGPARTPGEEGRAVVDRPGASDPTQKETTEPT